MSTNTTQTQTPSPWTFGSCRFEAALSLQGAWAVRWPQLATRLEKAVFLAAGVQPTDHPAVFTVRSSNGKGTYVVRRDRKTCSCPDHREARCKHQLAVALWVQTQGC